MNTNIPLILASLVATCALLMGAVEKVDARGLGRGGGFSRVGPAAGGGFAMRGGGLPSGFNPQTRIGTGSRQAGAAQMSTQRSQTLQGVSSNRAQTAQSFSRDRAAALQQGQEQATQRTQTRANTRTQSQEQVTQRQTQRQSTAGQSREDWQQHQTTMQGDRQSYQNQAREDRQNFYANEGQYHGGYYVYDNDNWDDGEVAATAIGAAAIGAVGGYAAGTASTGTNTTSQTVVYTAPPPTGIASLPCNPSTTIVGGATYFRCGSTWYTQAYGSSGVIFIAVPAPSQ